jgi:UPF0176 protein
MNGKQIIVAAFYRFVTLDDLVGLKPELLSLCETNGIKGTILLANEGINATVSGSRQAIDQLTAYLRADGRFDYLEYKESVFDRDPFYRMKVKLKKEIVTLGIPGTDPNQKTGCYVTSDEWNRLISDPDLILLDVRNDYESDIGSFKNAIYPNTKTFRDFPEYVKNNLDPKIHKKIAMFCTGGIRCEKASSYMLEQGFEEVYQLHGGILRYLEETTMEDSLWEGECFVFDGRVAVNQELTKGEYETCYSCRKPVSEEDRQSEYYIVGVSCPGCFHTLSYERRQSLEERQRQVRLAEERNQQHIGVRQQN